MSFDPTDLSTVASLPPEERRRLEDLAVEAVLREANAQDEARDPAGYQVAREHAEEVARAIGPVPPEAEEAVRIALAEVARHILNPDA